MQAEALEHPAFPRPAGDAKLWRYMDWHPKFAGLVTERRLWMSSLDMLKTKDELEGSASTRAIPGLDTALENARSHADRATIGEGAERWRRLADGIGTHCYVSSWAMDTAECPLLWGEYTTGPRSVVIQTTAERLERSLPSYVYIGKIRYIDYEAEAFPTTNIFHPVMHKRPKFHADKEVRVIANPVMTMDELGGREWRDNIFSSTGSHADSSRICAPPINLAVLI